MAFVVTEYMNNLANDLKTKRSIGDTTVQAYMRNLVQLNDKKPFKNLNFLKDVDATVERVNRYAISTRNTMIATVCSVLSMYSQPAMKKAYKRYSEVLNKLKEELTTTRGDTMEKTEKEDKNWVKWDDVVTKRDELRDEVLAYGANITLAEYEKLLAYLLLCLFTYIPPRRNMDYQEMYVTRKWDDKMDKDRNYLDLHGQRFIFNVYKSARSSGQQIVDIPTTDEESPLKDAIVQYLKHNPHYRASKNKSKEFRFLVKADGTPMTAVNSITRILNKTFGKKVGSSMLRHSYLSSKYGSVMEEMKEDSEMMAHNMDTQKKYIRSDGSDSDEDVIRHT